MSNLFTLSSPALASFGGSVYLVYQGLCISPVNQAFNIFNAVYDGSQWENYGPIAVEGSDPPYNNLQTSGTPALGVYDNTLYLIYGIAGGLNYWASFVGSGTWQSLGEINAYPGQSCSGSASGLYSTPGIVMGGGQNPDQNFEVVVLGYVSMASIVQQQQVVYAVYGGQPGMICWHGPFNTGLPTISAPGVATLGSTIYFVYRRAPDNVICWAQVGINGVTNLGPIMPSSNLTTAASPALAVLGDTLVMVYQNTSPAGQICLATYSNGSWSNYGVIYCGTDSELFTPASPALAVLNETLVMVYQSTSPPGQLCQATNSAIAKQWTNCGPISV